MAEQPPQLNRSTTRRLLAALAWPLLTTLAAQAHEIPNDVTVTGFVTAEDDRLVVVLRVPLEAMVDIEFPTFGPGYLDIDFAGDALRDAAQLWIANDLELYEDGSLLPQADIAAVRAEIPSDRSFATFQRALENAYSPPLPSSTQLVWQQAMLDIVLQTPISSPNARFSIRPKFERLGLQVAVVIRFVLPTGTERAYRIEGRSDVVQLDPRWHQAAARFVATGFRHILEGWDHLLFVLCLVIPFRRDVKALVWIITAFTIAHSITLGASALGYAPGTLWFPSLIEALIAASILYMAIENLFGPTLRTRWLIAFAFGLIHGFGFAFALRESLQFAGRHIATSLFSFNVGVELGQLLVLLVFIVSLNLMFRWVRQERLAIIVISIVIGHTAWHWMADRLSTLSEYQI